MPDPTPTDSRIGPFRLLESQPLPGSGPWFRAERVGYGRGPSEVLICVAHDDAQADVLRSAHRALCTLHHPIWPRPVGWYNGARALALHATAGASLDTLVAARAADAVPLTSATLLDIAAELSAALVHAHRNGLVHGAFIPQNLTIGADGALTVWGLGESRPVPRQWAAPEPGPAHIATDQWHLGATLVALVKGHAPWTSAGPTRTSSSPARVLTAQWPALARVLGRMTAPMPRDRYPTVQAARRDLLALARRTTTPSQRRDLGRALHTTPSSLPIASSERSSMAKPPRIQIPMPSTATPATELHDVPTEPPTSPRRSAPRPQESVAVVRPSVGAYVPTASVAASRSPFADVQIDPSPNTDIPVVAVEFDDTDHGQPQPLGPSMATDDMPVPTPDDLFGGLEMFDGDPLDAPTAATRATPSPRVQLRKSGPTAVPTTDPGFGTVSLDLEGTEGSFFSDAAAGVQGVPNVPEPFTAARFREPSTVERVAQGMVVANAALFALWFVVRVF